MARFHETQLPRGDHHFHGHGRIDMDGGGLLVVLFIVALVALALRRS